MAHDVRDQVVDFVRRWSEKTEIGAGRFVGRLGVTSSKVYRSQLVLQDSRSALQPNIVLPLGRVMERVEVSAR